MTGTMLRFVNFLLDTCLFLIIMMGFFYIFREEIAREQVKWISLVSYFFYYFLFEYISGKTPGKLVTRSQVVSTSNERRVFPLQIILRTLMRFIPIDIISYLFSYRGLHDRISGTTLIKL